MGQKLAIRPAAQGQSLFGCGKSTRSFPPVRTGDAEILMMKKILEAAVLGVDIFAFT